ncbi:MAG: serine O-acetyltransferase [Eggerthellaceae bacterium]|nr:serine O-acetyltransferase [Eggerthellaceae bacterium]
MAYFRTVKEDLDAAQKNDPASVGKFMTWLIYPGQRARRAHILQHFLWKKGMRRLPRFLSNITRFSTGIEIHPGAEIGRRFFIDHGMGVIIGETSIIGDDCVIYQGVTLGGIGKEEGKRHPTIGNNVMVGVGASVLGDITIGNNSKVGAGAVVVQDVPPYSTVVGVPGKIVRNSDINSSELKLTAASQRHEELPDPSMQKIEALQRELDKLKREIAFIKEKA